MQTYYATFSNYQIAPDHYIKFEGVPKSVATEVMFALVGQNWANILDKPQLKSIKKLYGLKRLRTINKVECRKILEVSHYEPTS